MTGNSRLYSHLVKFYDDGGSLARIVADFLEPGLQRRLPVIVIATSDHRALFDRECMRRGVNLPQLEADGDLQMVDVEAMLTLLMPGHTLDPVRFHATIDWLIYRACKGRPPCRVRAYSEMADILWARGNTAGAIQVETLWNRIATNTSITAQSSFLSRTLDDRELRNRLQDRRSTSTRGPTLAMTNRQ